MKTARAVLLTTLIILLTTAIHARATTWSTTFWNDFTADQIYLHLVGGDVEFGGFSSLPGSWTTLVDTPTELFTGGPSISPHTIFAVIFDTPGTVQAPYQMEWAELAGGSVLGSGTLIYNGSSFSGNSTFTSTIPTPLPGSAWLLVSGLAAAIGMRRRPRS